MVEEKREPLHFELNDKNGAKLEMDWYGPGGEVFLLVKDTDGEQGGYGFRTPDEFRKFMKACLMFWQIAFSAAAKAEAARKENHGKSSKTVDSSRGEGKSPG